VRVALIGGTGFIGHHVSRWLVEADTDVTVIHRGQTRGQVPGLRSLIADRKDTPALTAALATTNPDVVVDMTAYTGEDVERLLSALPASLARLVLVSSGDVYWTYGSFLGLDRANATAVPPDEQSPLREQLYPYRAKASGPEDLLYSYDKIVVERIARDGCRVPVTVLRLPMVYGPGDRQNRVGGYLERFAASGGTLLLNSAEAGWRCTRGYVEDVAWAIRVAALDERAAGETFNVGEGDALTELEWVRAIAEVAGWPGQILGDAETPPSLPAQWSTHLVVDTRRIRRVLGYREPLGREEGLRRTIRR
jgi:nucleoside-diphosphate-sugar epimerase